jgi:formiminoglutamase
MTPDWLEIHRGEAPLVVGFPHTGAEIPPGLAERLVSPWRATRDADWWVDRLYDFARSLGATTVRTRISRTAIDVNRDPSGASLYPGQATTELCPTTTFDGEPLYREGLAPDEAEIAARLATWFEPYHRAVEAELERLRRRHGVVVLYDAHSIRSRIPRLFEGELPHFNIGTNSGKACDPRLAEAVLGVCEASPFRAVLDGRFKGGWTTRRYGRPETGVHAIQMELGCRTYMREPDAPPTEADWPSPFEAPRAERARAVLKPVLEACLAFAMDPASRTGTPA